MQLQNSTREDALTELCILFRKISFDVVTSNQAKSPIKLQKMIIILKKKLHEIQTVLIRRGGGAPEVLKIEPFSSIAPITRLYFCII